MLTKPTAKSRPSTSPSNDRFLNDLQSLSKALSLPHPSRPKPKPLPPPKPSPNPQSQHPTKWSSWRNPLKSLTHRRLSLHFTVHFHHISSLPPSLPPLPLTLLSRPLSHSQPLSTRPSAPVNSRAHFDQSVTHLSTVYFSKTTGKYQPKVFLISATSANGIILGEYRVDMTRLLPLSVKELFEDGKGSGMWSTSFRLDGIAKGAVVSVSFGYSVVKDETARLNLSRQGSVGVGRRRHERTRSVDDVKILHEVLTCSKGFECEEIGVGCDDVKFTNDDCVNRKIGVGMECVGVTETKFCMLPEGAAGLSSCLVSGTDGENGNGESSGVNSGLVCATVDGNGNEVSSGVKLDLASELVEEDEDRVSLQMKSDLVPEVVEENENGESAGVKLDLARELVEDNGMKELDEPEFQVIEQGIEIASEDQVSGVGMENNVVVNVGNDSNIADGGGTLTALLNELQELELSNEIKGEEGTDVVALDSVVDELDSIFDNHLIVQPDNLETPKMENLSKHTGCDDGIHSSRSSGSSRRCRSFDDVTADEFIRLLGLPISPLGLSSDSDPESPRERLWKQFQKESLISSDGLFGLEPPDAAEQEDMKLGDYYDDFDLSEMVREAEVELQKAAEVTGSKSSAKILEDAETEILMHEWGFDEKAFQSSPPGSRCGFGSPIDLPPEEPIGLPPLGEGLGPFIQTKDGGFLRSLNPALFRTAKNNGSLVMQVSSPIVVPAVMGSGIMEILQCMASLGIEKLSMQANKLMPLEDITGKTMQQVCYEAAPALKACESHDLLQCPEIGTSISESRNGRRKGKGASSTLQRVGDTSSEYVSLEDLAPLAMDKIEALSIEGLRIQSGMSNEDAPSNISAQSIGEFSALEGKQAMNSSSLGLEGMAGLQLMDVKGSGDVIDSLMGMSVTLDEWMKLDAGILDDEDQISERTSKVLAAHQANSLELFRGGCKGDGRGNKKSGKKWGLLGNNFTVALMVQLRDPLRNYEPVGAPMLSLIQVERVFVPPKPKFYCTVSDKGNSEQEDFSDTESKPVAKEKSEGKDAVIQFKITEVHVAGIKTQPEKKNVWGNPTQQQSGSRWLLATGMGKSNKHPFMKSKTIAKPSQATKTVQPGDTLWSISSQVHGNGAKWKELAALNPHIRNPNIILPNTTIRLR